MELYWVGTNTNWHDNNNWSVTSGGVGGAGIPTSIDDVFFDGNGNVLCQPTSNIECNNLSLLASATEMLLIDASASINGDFFIEGGTFSPFGGPNHIIEFKGNWEKTGGTFSVGTGIGIDPTCIFSGNNKTYQLNDVGSASYQNVSITGSYVFSGTRTTVANIGQKLSVEGIMSIYGNLSGTIRNQIYLNGVNAGFDIFTGTIEGNGRFVYIYRESSLIPATGTIKCRYFKLLTFSGLVSESIDENLVCDSWLNVHQDWIHNGTEPYLHDDDEDTNYISLPAEEGSIGLYDEYYTIENIDSDNWESFSLNKLKIHLKGRLYNGTGGHATLVAVRAYLWDGIIWQDGGTASFLSTSYMDRICNIDLSSIFTTISQLDGMRLKLEIDTVIAGGSDKGGINITQAWIEIEGISYHNPLLILNPRTWENPCQLEIEYTDNGQCYRLEGINRHYFLGGLTILGDDPSILTAEFDCNTNTAEMWIEGKFDIYKDAFPMGIFTLKFGDGTHVFRGSIDFYFSYTSTNTQLIVDAGEGTIILYPQGLKLAQALGKSLGG